MDNPLRERRLIGVRQMLTYVERHDLPLPSFVAGEWRESTVYLGGPNSLREQFEGLASRMPGAEEEVRTRKGDYRYRLFRRFEGGVIYALQCRAEQICGISAVVDGKIEWTLPDLAQSQTEIEAPVGAREE